MTQPTSPEDLEPAARAALDRLAARKRTLAARTGGPRLGDLYVFEQLALDATVSWALVLQHPDDPDSFVAVPADDNPLVGGDDVGVPAGEGSGPLTLRCGYTTWIGRRHLTPERLDGWVDDAILAEARAAIRCVATGARRGGFEQREIEATADYEDWIAVIADAETRLSELLAADDPAAPAITALTAARGSEDQGSPPVRMTLHLTSHRTGPRARVAWGPAPAAASSGIVHWPDIALTIEGVDGELALVDGVTDPAKGTSFRLLQFDGPRSPAPRLVLTFFDHRGQVIAIAGEPAGLAPGDAFQVQEIAEAREIAEIEARRIV